MLGLPENSIDRVHFIIPEYITHLPSHMSLSCMLWCSSDALVKLRLFTRRFKHSLIIPSNVSWVEKRLSYYLQVPCLAPGMLLYIYIHTMYSIWDLSI